MDSSTKLEGETIEILGKILCKYESLQPTSKYKNFEVSSKSISNTY
jgi:hypothetical protein